MSCLDNATLWAMDAGELASDDLAAALTHARSCLVCELARRELQQTRNLLSLAGAAAGPAVSWRSVDAALDDALTKEAAKTFSAGWWQRLLVPAFVLAAAAVAFAFVGRPAPVAKSLAPIAVAPIVVQKPGLAVAPKEELAPEKKTQRQSATPKTLSTANGSRIDLGKSGVARKVKGDVVELQSGEALIRGKSGLVLRARGAKLQPQSNAVFVASLVRELDVAVAEGAVLVERDDGSVVVVHAGERFTRAGVVKSAESQRFSAFGITVAATAAAPPRSMDLLFIQRARLSLKQGKCGEFLLGLETLAFDAEEPTVRAQARITKAHCHDERLEPAKAAAEYSRYVRDFPDGEAAAEAREALAHQ